MLILGPDDNDKCTVLIIAIIIRDIDTLFIHIDTDAAVIPHQSSLIQLYCAAANALQIL